MMMKGNGRGFANPCYVDPTGKALEQNGYKAAPLGHAFGYAPKTDYVKSQGYGKPRFGSEQFDARPGQHQNKFPQKAAKFNADYDFETANRMFAEIVIGDPKDIKNGMGPRRSNNHELSSLDKSEGAPKAKDVQLPDEDVKQNKVFYKKSAFFDDISSDDKDRRSGKDVRPDWHIQRKTDGETFGPGTHEVISRHARHNNDTHQRHARADGAAH
ncbi:Protein CAR-1 [Aphelenchoides avenae]|nr:Protein CAR-1 [Aphelenchus avenae]